MSAGLSTQELRLAPSGEGPHAANWSDKPHRVLYDACRLAEERQAVIDGIRAIITEWNFGPADERKALEAIWKLVGDDIQGSQP